MSAVFKVSWPISAVFRGLGGCVSVFQAGFLQFDVRLFRASVPFVFVPFVISVHQCFSSFRFSVRLFLLSVPLLFSALA